MLFPTLLKTLRDLNLAQYYSISAYIASLDATTLAVESFIRKKVV
jgi:hypothetical protein